MDLNYKDFLRELSLVMTQNRVYVVNPRTKGVGVTMISNLAWKELVAYYPEIYSGHKFPGALFDPQIAFSAGEDYLRIVRSYLLHYKIPITIESLTASYIWGVSNLREHGLEKAPDDVKYYIAQLRHRLEPTAWNLDVDAQKR